MQTDLTSITDRIWDYLIIGTGMGGATLGHALASRGASVMFVERGASHFTDDKAWLGNFAESSFPHPTAPGTHHRDQLKAAGRYADSLHDMSNPDKPREFIPFIGSGTGGSSALYGMALERFSPSDFTPASSHSANTEAALPEAWPVSFEELLPFYRQAEQLYRVRGGLDPLRDDPTNHYLPPQPLSGANQRLFDHFEGQGLHPYQLPLACEHVPGCQTCQSFLCAKGCKNDASRICLSPALEQHEARLLDDCEVIRLDATDSKINAAICHYKGETVSLKARQFICAAGALQTPRLLLNSACSDWPEGLANREDLVGRYLMRHYIDLYAVLCSPDPKERTKEIAFNDFYQQNGEKLGSVQSFGLLPPASLLVEEIASDIRHDAGPWLAAAFSLVKPLARFGLAQMLSRSLLLASTLEDLPFADNRVSLGNRSANGQRALHIHYRIRPSEQKRIDSMRRKMTSALKPKHYLLLKQADSNQRIAHVCGTARFGHDPKHSVCDAQQKAHGIDNLYIADSSVFPTSGGINPSLTIAALSLRLAQHLETQ